jgi:DNA polymerase
MFCLLDENKKPIKGTGFDLRRCLKGPFYVTDYNQVEARGLLALVKDERILPKLREGMSVYQAHAETTMGRTWEDLKTEDVPLYQQKKMEVLLLGFGGGAARLARAAYLMTKDDPRPEAVIRWTEAEAQVVVDGFRNHTRDYICRLWSKLQRMAEKAASARKELMIIRLPSGRPMYYWNARKRTVKVIRKTDEGDKLVERTEIFSQNAKGDPSSYRKLYGGLLTENVVQAMCRDVLRDGWVALHEAGYDVAFTAHDEYVVELKPGQTGEDVDKLLLETGNNSWAAFIPLGLDGHLVDFYTK